MGQGGEMTNRFSAQGDGIRVGNFAVYHGEHVPIIDQTPLGYVLDLEKPTTVTREQLDDHYFIDTTAVVHGDSVDVIDVSGDEVTVRVEGSPEWVAALDAHYDRDEYSWIATGVRIDELTDLRERVTHIRS